MFSIHITNKLKATQIVPNVYKTTAIFFLKNASGRQKGRGHVVSQNIRNRLTSLVAFTCRDLVVLKRLGRFWHNPSCAGKEMFCSMCLNYNPVKSIYNANFYIKCPISNECSQSAIGIFLAIAECIDVPLMEARTVPLHGSFTGTPFRCLALSVGGVTVWPERTAPAATANPRRAGGHPGTPTSSCTSSSTAQRLWGGNIRGEGFNHTENISSISVLFSHHTQYNKFIQSGIQYYWKGTRAMLLYSHPLSYPPGK